MRRIALSVVVVVCSVTGTDAQEDTQQGSPRFEVASIRPCSVEGISSEQLYEWFSVATPNVGIRYYKPCSTVWALVLFAYDLPNSRVRGGPHWISIDTFRVEARALAPVAIDEMRLLVRQLLADRFAFKSHAESALGRVHTIVLAHPDRGLGPNAKPSAFDCSMSADAGSLAEAIDEGTGLSRCKVSGDISNGALTMTGTGLTAAAFVKSLPGIAGTTVVDGTGISGLFDFIVSYATDGQRLSEVRPRAADWQRALERQLNLKLESTRGQVEVLVIDSVQQPTEN